MKDNAFCYTLRVRYSEVDVQGIVFNSRYLEYIDIGQTEYLRHCGITLAGVVPDGRMETALVKATVEYLASARVDQEIDVWAWVDRVGTKSFTMGFEIYPHGAKDPLIVRAEMIYVSYSVARRAAVPIPDDVRAMLLGGMDQ